jgi:hypothetical protein
MRDEACRKLTSCILYQHLDDEEEGVEVLTKRGRKTAPAAKRPNERRGEKATGSEAGQRLAFILLGYGSST